MTRNASEFLLRSVACREYTLPRDDPASEAKGWIQGNTRIGPILEVTTSFQHFKFGVEVRIQSVNGRIIFMSMFADIMWRENDNTDEYAQNATEVGRWSFWGPGLENTWYKTCSDKPNREWDCINDDTPLGHRIWSHSVSNIQCLSGKKSTTTTMRKTLRCFFEP